MKTGQNDEKQVEILKENPGLDRCQYWPGLSDLALGAHGICQELAARVTNSVSLNPDLILTEMSDLTPGRHPADKPRKGVKHSLNLTVFRHFSRNPARLDTGLHCF